MDSNSKPVKSDKKKKKSHSHKHRDDSPPAASSSPAPGAASAVAEEEDWDANRTRVEALCKEYPNNVCNDCNESGTRWAAANFGVFICIRCAGVHRSLGTHVSKVKSTNMDKWSASEVDLMAAVGNTRGKALYEARLSGSSASAKPLAGNETEDAVKRFIVRKYVDMEFATDKAAKLLRRLQKQVGYGDTKPTKTTAGSRSGEAADGASGATETRNSEAARAQRQRMLQGLYGQDHLVSRKATEDDDDDAGDSKAGKKSAAKGATSHKDAHTASSSSSHKKVHGAFGVVNVPSEEYDARLLALLTAFGCAPAAVSTPSPMPSDQAATASATTAVPPTADNAETQGEEEKTKTMEAVEQEVVQSPA